MPILVMLVSNIFITLFISLFVCLSWTFISLRDFALILITVKVAACLLLYLCGRKGSDAMMTLLSSHCLADLKVHRREVHSWTLFVQGADRTERTLFAGLFSAGEQAGVPADRSPKTTRNNQTDTSDTISIIYWSCVFSSVVKT